MSILLISALFLWFCWMFLDHRIHLVREMGRFSEQRGDLYNQFSDRIGRWLASIGVKSVQQQGEKAKRSRFEREMTKKLQLAGLESARELGQFQVLRFACVLGGPLIGAIGYLHLSTYYATVLTLFSTSLGLFLPQLWLKAKIAMRLEDIQRELPLLIDLTNLGTSAGWDVTAALERVIDALSVEFPHHPLIKEYKKARWLTATGYTWNESLERINKKLDNTAVRRCNLALGQAMRAGGDRTTQLEGIAEDAQRFYYASLDKRLAALPVKAVLITMLLFIAYFMILMAPAGVQIKNAIPKSGISAGKR